MLEICKLENEIRYYDWGSRTALAQLQGRSSPTERPEAELWMGTHRGAPSKIVVDDDKRILLPDVLELPFLFKVLAVERPLSLQAHPDRQQTIEGFRREDEAGIARDDERRNYRDDQPKPEILFALTEFRMLRGFRTPADVLDLLRRCGLLGLLPELAFLRREGDLERVFRAWMDFDPARLPELLAAVERKAGDTEAAFWIRRLNGFYPGDRCALAPLFLHVHRLEKNEAIYTGPGVLHAYLDGLGIELMTNSDNVVRCGLTSKFRDVPELLRILKFRPEPPRHLEAVDVARGDRRFKVPETDLVLSVHELEDGCRVESRRARGTEILLCTEGSAELAAATGKSVVLKKGDSLLLPASAGRYELKGAGRLFRAG